MGEGAGFELSIYFVEIFADFLSTEKASRRRHTNILHLSIVEIEIKQEAYSNILGLVIFEDGLSYFLRYIKITFKQIQAKLNK